MSLPLTLAVAFRNEAKRLPQLLASVDGLIGEVVYGNNASTDDSEDLLLAWCRSRGIPARGFVEEKVVGYPEPFFQRMFDLATQPWTLLVGADETLTAQGRQFLSDATDERLSDVCSLRMASVVIGSFDGMRPSEVNVTCYYHLRLWRTGSVVQPPYLHTQVRVKPGKSVEKYGDQHPYLIQAKSGFDQLRRDKARGQYPEIELPEVDPYERFWGEMFAC